MENLPFHMKYEAIFPFLNVAKHSLVVEYYFYSCIFPLQLGHHFEYECVSREQVYFQGVRYEQVSNIDRDERLLFSIPNESHLPDRKKDLNSNSNSNRS